MRLGFLFAKTLMVLLAASALLAQNPTATLVGSVRDASGAAVMGAALDVRASDTAQTRHAVANERGEFTVPNLVPGPYEITITKQGFSTLRTANIVLQMDQVARMDFKLEIGSVTQSVEVTGAAPLIASDNGTRGEVMSSAEILEMPLNGRNFVDLVYLVPGVSYASNSNYASTIATNGGRTDNNNFLIDGSSANNTLQGGPSTSVNIDAIQEFKVHTNNFSAEYGRMAGSAISVALKSGSNQYHGSLFEFLQNDLVNARNFFDTSQKSALRRNQFGGAFEGPVLIPKLYNGKDRTFFLFSWESYRQMRGAPALGVVPTVAQRAGDFSKTGPIADPLSPGSCPGSTGKGACFPGSLVPASRQSTQALAVQKYYPQPNLPGLNNMAAYGVSPTDSDSMVMKFDEHISSRDSVSMRYTIAWTANSNSTPGGTNNTGLFGTSNSGANQLVGLTHTHLFTPNFISELRLTFTRSTSNQLGAFAGTDYNAKLGILGGTSDPSLTGFPLFNVTGYQQIGPYNFLPFKYWLNSWPLADTVTWVKGGHTVKAGLDVLHNQNIATNYQNSNGTYNSTGYWTGQAYADFLLGYLNSSIRLATPNVIHFLTTSYNSFVQDDWKATSRLTLNLGLRWEINKPPIESAGKLSNFVPSLGKAVIASSKTLESAGVAVSDPAHVTTAAEAGLPQSLVFTNYRAFAPRFGFAWRPFGGNKTVVRGGYGIFFGSAIQGAIRNTLSNIFPFTITQTINLNASNPLYLTLANPFPVAPNLSGSLSTVGVGSFEIHPPNAYLQSWNFTMEREIGFSSALKFGYVGSKGTHFGMPNNLNQPYDRSAALPGGITPYPGWGSINYFSMESKSAYHGATATWQRRFVRGFFYTANYTFSKSLDTSSQFQFASTGGVAGLQNVRCLMCDWGRSDFDRRHIFTSSFSWESRYRNVLIHGWQLAGTPRLYSALPFTATNSSANLNLGQAIRPNRIGTGTVPNPGPAMWFNVKDFPLVPNGAFGFGNAGRNILDGPGRIDVNLSLNRNFVLHERHRLQVRWDIFNVINHANFAVPINTVNASNAGTLTAADPGRVMQFALRYSF